jgi:hypothetical protein
LTGDPILSDRQSIIEILISDETPPSKEDLIAELKNKTE